MAVNRPSSTFAIQLGRNQSNVERPLQRPLQRALRSGQRAGAEFRRQVPVGPSIVDFYASKQC